MLLSLDPILLDLALVFGLCVAVGVLFWRVRIPPMVGFLVAGAIVGPNALGLVTHQQLVVQLAEVGVVVLLFSVGLEFSFELLARMRSAVLVGGSVQMVATIALGMLAALVGGLEFGPALFLGFLLAMSSTAAVTRLLLDRGAITSPAGRFAVGICVAQDLAVVPIIVVLPLLAGAGGGDSSPAHRILRAVVVVAVAVIAGTWLFPRVLDLVSRTRSREIFLLAVITLCLAVAIATAEVGLSLAIGAFLAGVIVAGTEYRHQAVSEVEPFRDALASLFFVSIGMLFDWRVIAGNPLGVLAALAAVVLGKTLLVLVAGAAVGLPRWLSLQAGLMLAQVGEFSFVLVQVASGFQLLPPPYEQLFLVVAVLSMACTPLFFWLGRCFVPHRVAAAEAGKQRAAGELSDHVILIGFGVGGQSVARALERLHIDYVAIEMNAATVRAEKRRGVRIFLGDATRVLVLRAAGIATARLLVVALNDAFATRRAVDLARTLAPGIRIIARTQFLSEMPQLRELGVHDVVPQELETSIEILVRVLRYFVVPDDDVDREVHAVREEWGATDKQAPRAGAEATRLTDFLPGIGFEVYRVEAGSEVAGRALAELAMRQSTGCTLAAIRRGKAVVLDIDAKTALQPGDIAVLVGPQAKLRRAGLLFAAAGPAPPAPSAPAATSPS